MDMEGFWKWVARINSLWSLALKVCIAVAALVGVIGAILTCFDGWPLMWVIPFSIAVGLLSGLAMAVTFSSIGFCVGFLRRGHSIIGRLRDVASGPANFFVGQWCLRVNNTTPETFMAELRDDYTAKRSASDNVLATIGTWKLVNGNALVEWDDGWKDLLRRTDHGVEKLAFWNNEQEPRDISPAKKQT